MWGRRCGSGNLNHPIVALTPTLRQLLHEHIHLAPAAWTQAPAPVRASFSSPFEPAQRLAHELERLPPSLLTWWAALPDAHILLGDQRGYSRGRLPDDPHGRANVVQIALADLANPAEGLGHAWFWIAHLLDHHLGCLDTAEGPWLSDGAGFSPRWQEVGQRIAALARLGYSAQPEAAANPHAYLAAGVALFIADRAALNVQDPKLERLLATTLLHEGFCRRALTATTPANQV